MGAGFIHYIRKFTKSRFVISRFECTRAFIREEIKYSEKYLTNRMPRRTETPFKFSAKRSTKEANTMTRSKTFHPLWKYSFDIPNNLRTASVVKNVVNTLLPTSRVCLSSSLMPWCSAAKSRNRTFLECLKNRLKVGIVKGKKKLTLQHILLHTDVVYWYK